MVRSKKWNFGPCSTMSRNVQSQNGSRAAFLKDKLKAATKPLTAKELTLEWIVHCEGAKALKRFSGDYKIVYRNITQWLSKEVKRGRVFIRMKDIPPHQYNGYLTEPGPVEIFEEQCKPGEPTNC